MTPSSHVENIRSLLSCLEKHNLKVAPAKVGTGATAVLLFGIFCFRVGLPSRFGQCVGVVRNADGPGRDLVSVIPWRFLLVRKFLARRAKRVQRLNMLLKKTVPFGFTPAMTDIVRELLQELSKPTVLAFPDWNAAHDRLLNASVPIVFDSFQTFRRLRGPPEHCFCR